MKRLPGVLAITLIWCWAGAGMMGGLRTTGLRAEYHRPNTSSPAPWLPPSTEGDATSTLSAYLNAPHVARPRMRRA